MNEWSVLFGLIGIIVFCVWVEYEKGDMNRKIESKVMDKGEKLRREFKSKGKLKYFTYFINHEYFAVVDNYLHVNIGTLKGKTNINNIIGTEIKYHVSQKNKMRFMSIMPTYDKYTKLVKIELILYREGRGDVNFILDPNVVDDQSIKKLKLILDKMIGSKEENK